MRVIIKRIVAALLCIVMLNLLTSCDSEDTLDSSAVKYISYDNINHHLLFHHIEYEGTPYYYLDVGHEVPEEYTLFGDEISVTLVDKGGDAYDETRLEKAYTYNNDEDNTYIYYISATFTKDKSKGVVD